MLVGEKVPCISTLELAGATLAFRISQTLHEDRAPQALASIKVHEAIEINQSIGHAAQVNAKPRAHRASSPR
jgi:hypothetical protein